MSVGIAVKNKAWFDVGVFRLQSNEQKVFLRVQQDGVKGSFVDGTLF
jgi:hypothetical protein